MWKKNGKTFVPPLADGEEVVYNPTVDQMLAAGYVWVEPTPAPRPKPRSVYTKLSVRRAMRELGIEQKLDALLATSEEFKKDWDDAQDINLSDPVLLRALAAGSISSEEIVAIKRKIAGK